MSGGQALVASCSGYSARMGRHCCIVSQCHSTVILCWCHTQAAVGVLPPPREGWRAGRWAQQGRGSLRGAEAVSSSPALAGSLLLFCSLSLGSWNQTLNGLAVLISRAYLACWNLCLCLRSHDFPELAAENAGWGCSDHYNGMFAHPCSWWAP